MNFTIVFPSQSHRADSIAADTFSSLAEKVSGDRAEIISDDEYLSRGTSENFTVLIGNDAVNNVTAGFYLKKQIDGFGIRYGTDDYCIRTAELDGKSYLFLAGGRPRASIYAVYRYFERFCGCRYFWDGDRIPKAELVLSGIDVTESPRFDYRGLRYFAHRTVHRFQAEHWGFEDWTTEIDWVLKKRLNLVMLRIGMDDLFQKAFPDVVSYPNRDEKLPEAGPGYDDRTLFWSLEYRGELRKKILEYVFERDLMHPEDCGTMSHWYSRTPHQFLEKMKPDLLPQSGGFYNDPTGRVWDIRRKENFENYMKLTEAHIKAYGKPELFHTIGLGERMYSEDPEENRRMKLYVYRKITSYLKEHYPNSPLLIAGWDLWMTFSPEEVQELVAELDPSQSIIFDYTSDTVRKSNFTNWGVINKFPWVFGIFSAYEPSSEIRGFYELTNERLKLAKDDPMCKGLILWPELSHGDPFVIDYFTRNAWSGDTLSIPEMTDLYCTDRYPESIAEDMRSLWRDFMPIVALAAWNIDSSWHTNGHDIFPTLMRRAGFVKDKAGVYQKRIVKAAPLQKTAVALLEKLSALPLSDELTRRDFYDIARTIISRYINIAISHVEYLYAVDAPIERIERMMQGAEELLALFTELLASHEDYSMYASLLRLRSIEETNPNFEETLKENASCSYCRSHIYETAAYLYRPELSLMFSEVKKAIAESRLFEKECIKEGLESIRKRYFETPLAEMKMDPRPYAEVVADAARLIDSFDLSLL